MEISNNAMSSSQKVKPMILMNEDQLEKASYFKYFGEIILDISLLQGFFNGNVMYMVRGVKKCHANLHTLTNLHNQAN